MSKGSPRVTIRISEQIRTLIDADCEQLNNGGRSTRHWDLTEWVRSAISEKIAHRRRSRKAPAK